MSSPAKLKKQALQLEHDRQYEKALAIYARLIDEPGGGDDETDVALYNRAGDLALRVGDPARAVGYYERAVDLYAAGGLLNNAIALCNKILRHAPESVATHYSLGVLHGKQGFRGDAKYHFVEYADRMHRAGNDAEALRALREFADLCDPGDDARALLGQQLARTGKGGSAAAALQAVFDTGAAPARPSVASAAPVAASEERPSRAAAAPSLVFLDLSGAAALAEEPVAAVVGLEAAVDFAVPTTPDASSPGAPADLLLDAWAPADAARAMGDTSWNGASTDGLPLIGAAGAAAGPAYPHALPGELPILELPLARAWQPAGGRAAVLDDAPLESPLDSALDSALDGGLLDLAEPSALTFLALDAEPVSAAEPRAAVPEAGAALVVEELPLLDLADAPGVVDAWEPGGDPASGSATLDALHVETQPPPAPELAAPVVAEPRSNDYVDLGDWLREVDAPRSSRMVTGEPSQTGDEQADFDRMLDAFKAGVERNIDGEDFDSHYDLGVAFREMGLLEEAVRQFQRASRAPGRPLRAIEALGECFVELGQPELAREALGRAMTDSGSGGALPDEQLVGVLYLLGVASEQTQRTDAAGVYFRRVLAIDIQFRDAARRLARLPDPTR